MSEPPVVNYLAPSSKEQFTRLRPWPEPIQDTPNSAASSPRTFRFWWKGIPALPSSQSTLILLGNIIDGTAHLTPDKTAIYSTFTITMDLIFKDLTFPQHQIGQTVTASRLGGAVLFPSGHIREFTMEGQGFPAIGEDYVLFLRSSGSKMMILTGYTNQNGVVSALDNSHGSSTHLPFRKFDGMDFKKFLDIVDDSIKFRIIE